MGLSKRERLIVIVTILVVGALVGDRLIRAPLANRWSELKGQRQQLLSQVTAAKNLIQQSALVLKKHPDLFSVDLRSATDVESKVAKEIDRWSTDARLNVSSVTPTRLTGDKGFKEIIFVVAGKGSLDAVAWFLYQAELSPLPLKVKYMQVSSASEAGDSLSLELRLSALYVAADEKPSTKQRQPKQAETTYDQQI